MKLIIHLFCIVGALLSQTQPQLTGLKIDVKRNGVFIRIPTTALIEQQNLSGWATETNWFYLTVFGAQSDTAIITGTRIKSPVTAIQSNNTEESTQIAIKFDRSIELFEYNASAVPLEISLSIRFPVDQVMADIIRDQDNSERSAARSEKTIQAKAQMYPQIRKILYFSGMTLAITGIIEQDSRTSGLGWELPTGIGILLGTYIYDTYIHSKIIRK